MAREPDIRHGVGVAVACLFVVAISLPLIGLLSGARSEMAGEKRELAPFPEWPPDRLKAFTADFEAFFNDRFPARDRLIRTHHRIVFDWLGDSPSADVIRGRDGWLFLGYNSAVNNYLRRYRLGPEPLERARRILEGRRDWLARYGARFVLVVVPDKHTIYPEYLPFPPAYPDTPPVLDQLLDYMAAHSDVPIIDLRPALMAAKASGPVYYKTNTHWNPAGAYAGYRVVAGRLGTLFPTIAPLPRNGFVEHALGPKDQDLVKLISLEGHLQEPAYEWERIGGWCAERFDIHSPGVERLPDYRRPFATVCREPGLPRAVMFRDSFATDLVPFLAEHFSHLIVEWRAYDREMAEYLVRGQHPHLFIEEVVERDLMREIMRGI